MIANVLKDFRIPRRARHCVQCQTLFVSGMEYYSFLNDNERNDFCVACWKIQEGVFWKSKVPNKAIETLSQHERALEVLREEGETDLGGVLALYLARKRVIAPRGDFDAFLTLYEVLETEEMLRVKKVELAKMDLQEIQFEISKRLDAGSSD